MSMKRSKKVNKELNKALVEVWAKLVISKDATTKPEEETKTVALVPKKYREAVDAWEAEWRANNK